MHWITVIWSMISAVCLALAAIHLVIWFRQRTGWGHLLFFASATAAAAIAMFELLLMRSETPEQFATLLRWAHVPLAVLLISIVWFVRVYLHAGREWLAWAVTATRILALILNFTTGTNLNYLRITELEPIQVLGDTIAIPHGIPNFAMLAGQINSLLLLIFVIDSTLTTWKKRERWRALTVNGSIVVFITIAAGHATLLNWGFIRSPYFVSFPFLFIVIAMGEELISEVFEAAATSRKLKVSEASLRESGHQMDLAARAAELAVWVWDIAKDDIWVTRAGRATFAVPADDTINLSHFIRSVHPDDRDSVSRAITSSITGDGEYESEYRAVIPGGDTRWFHGRGRVEFDAARKPVLLRGISLDITCRKQAENALRESEARFRDLANTAPVMIWTSGIDRLATFFNKGWIDFTGRTLHHELGMGWVEGIHHDDYARCEQVYASAFEARRSFTMEFRLRRHDNDFRTVLNSGVPRFNSNEQFLGFIGSCIDITERRRVEFELQQRRSELAHLSRVTMLGELSGSLAHELNQPLTAILSNAQAAQRFLTRNPVDLDEVRAILKDIVDDDKRAGEVIRRLRLLLTKGEVQQQALDVNEIVRDVLKLVHSDLMNHGVTVSVELEPDLPKVSADRVQLQQVLLNLIMNGCDAMAHLPFQERKLTLHTEHVDGEGVRISVVDGGCGIKLEVIDKVFEAFYTTKKQGMGLGLAVCQSIISAHNGRLWASNNVDRGASFHVAIPAKTIAEVNV